MKKTIAAFLSSFVWGSMLLAQTAVWPAANVTAQSLGYVQNGVTGQLSATVTPSATSLNVINGTCTLAGQASNCNVAFAANMFITIDNEIMEICSVTVPGGGVTTLNFGILGSACPSLSGRGLDGTQIAQHLAPTSPGINLVSNNIIAWNHNATNVEIVALETYLSTAFPTILTTSPVITQKATTYSGGCSPNGMIGINTAGTTHATTIYVCVNGTWVGL